MSGNPIRSWETLLDNYLRTLWTLSLSAPIDYIEKHPFDLAGAGGLDVYQTGEHDEGAGGQDQAEEDRKPCARNSSSARRREEIRLRSAFTWTRSN